MIWDRYQDEQNFGFDSCPSLRPSSCSDWGISIRLDYSWSLLFVSKILSPAKSKTLITKSLHCSPFFSLTPCIYSTCVFVYPWGWGYFHREEYPEAQNQRLHRRGRLFTWALTFPLLQGRIKEVRWGNIYQFWRNLSEISCLYISGTIGISSGNFWSFSGEYSSESYHDDYLVNQPGGCSSCHTLRRTLNSAHFRKWKSLQKIKSTFFFTSFYATLTLRIIISHA